MIESILISGISISFYPLLAEYAADKNYRGFSKAMGKSIRMFFFTGIPISIFLGFVAFTSVGCTDAIIGAVAETVIDDATEEDSNTEIAGDTLELLKTDVGFSMEWNNLDDEYNEVISITLSNPSNATLVDESASLTILDDDDAPTISIDDISADEGDEADTFTVSLSAASGKTITVNYLLFI